MTNVVEIHVSKYRTKYLTVESRHESYWCLSHMNASLVKKKILQIGLITRLNCKCIVTSIKKYR